MGKLNVVYLYMSHGPAPENANPKWDKDKLCGNRYVEKMKEDGSFTMLAEMKKRGLIDDLLVFYESFRDPGYACWGYDIFGWVCPQISFVNQFIDSNTVIYVRGGFRTWFKFLTSYKNKNWLMCYNANTGRERWTFWDIILWDLNRKQQLDRYNRLWYHYIKPVDQLTFRPYKQNLIYDVCIGASHIHDKKGQWKVIDVLIEYKRKYGVNLSAILPGSGSRGVETAQINTKIEQHGLNVVRTGMVSREELAKYVFGRSKCAMFLGTHGQGDRGPIEAMACGVPLVMGHSRYHSPYVYENGVSVMPKNLNNIPEIAELLHEFLNNLPSRESVVKYHRNNMGFYKVCYPNLGRIFQFIRKNPVPSLEAKKELLNHALTGTETPRV